MKLIYQDHSSAVKPSHPLAIPQHCNIFLSAGKVQLGLLHLEGHRKIPFYN